MTKNSFVAKVTFKYINKINWDVLWFFLNPVQNLDNSKSGIHVLNHLIEEEIKFKTNTKKVDNMT